MTRPCTGNSPIYNMLPDTLASLAHDDTVDMDTFRTIMRFLFGFVSKDKHAESLTDKLCHRFQTTGGTTQTDPLLVVAAVYRRLTRVCSRGPHALLLQTPASGAA